MYPNVKKISRQEYKQMLDKGIRFRNWTLYELGNHPKQTFFAVDAKGICILNKVPVED